MDASEVAQIEHELDILRASYADLERGATYLRSFFVVVLVGALLAFAYSLVTMNIPGIGLGALIASMAGAIVVGNHAHWIYLMNMRRRGERIGRLDAIETMIRDREERLAAIRHA
jgi:hypothetical protein